MIPAERLTKTIEIPEGVQIEITPTQIKIKGEKGEIIREWNNPTINIIKENNQVIIKPIKCTKKQKAFINTMVAHFKNMIEGVTNGFEYKLKICSGHFPMNVTVDNEKVIIKNFYGEKVPRKAKILSGVKVEIKGDDVTVIGFNKESVGQTAANIESVTKITNKDKRIFQDGIWIVEKNGNKI